jgi:foldase protein PrsA
MINPLKPGGRVSQTPYGRLILLLGITACSLSPGAGPEVILAKVNGERISLSEFNSYFQKNWPLPAEDDAVPSSLDIKLKFLNQLIEEKLIIMEAKRIGIQVTESELENRVKAIRDDYPENGFAKILIDNYIDYQEWKDSLCQKILVEKMTRLAVADRVAVSEDEIEAYYREYSEQFTQAEELHLRQIVLEDNKKANELRQRIIQGEDFQELARKYSRAPEAKTGGDLGWVAKGVLLRELEKEAFSLKPGAISRVVESPFGFHILKLEEKRDSRNLPLDEVSKNIERQIQEIKTEEVYRQWINMLWERASIQINYQLL